MRPSFVQQLAEMKNSIIVMSESVEQAIEQAVTSLKSGDLKLAASVVSADSRINAMELEIDRLCTHLIAAWQPFAGDLRRIVSAYKIISILERIGDLAADTAKVTLRIGDQPLIKPLKDLTRMAELVRTMIKTAISAFIDEDLDKARQTSDLDNDVDHCFSLICEDLYRVMSSDPSSVFQGMQLVLTARFIERIGDYSTNIGEEVIYIALGVRENLND
jgi:phosphate transport system protein